MSDDWKPCPFCGNQHPRLVEPNHASMTWLKVWVECGECEARSEPQNYHPADDYEGPWATIRSWAIEAWNRRALPSPPSQEGTR